MVSRGVEKMWIGVCNTKERNWFKPANWNPCANRKLLILIIFFFFTIQESCIITPYEHYTLVSSK